MLEQNIDKYIVLEALINGVIQSEEVSEEHKKIILNGLKILYLEKFDETTIDHWLSECYDADFQTNSINDCIKKNLLNEHTKKFQII